MLAVMTQYNSSHGEAVALVLLVPDNDEGLIKAVDTARNIESLGYHFGGNDIGAYVVRVQPGLPTRNKCQEYVFIHRFYGQRWAEEWVDDVAKSHYARAKVHSH